VLAPAAAEAAWDAKPDVPRFLYAGRLVAEKGVGVLLEALARLDAAGRPVAVDVMGEGGMAAAVAAGAARLQHAALTRRDPLPYGAPFLGALRGYHAVIVPSLSDEQPRILYDAFSQAVPAIASDTPGHRAVIGDAPCAVLVPAGDAGALAAALDAAAADGPGLRRSGLAALAVAEGRTHRAMHLARAAVLADLFGRPPS
jgi:glycosyltransferase involved in cell wall biosynthesis